MALTIQQLNADTTFLLTFSPLFAPERNWKRFPGDYKILLDPWLHGHSSILHPKFQISTHAAEPAITSLASLKHEVDLIIVSQDKPDHCHRDTLCSLPKDTKINILATPAAAKKIRSWKYFDSDRIHALKTYDASNKHSISRITLPSYSSSSAAGEITITNIPAKHDVTRLHNAIGITYQPPSTVFPLYKQSSRYEDDIVMKLSENGMVRSSSQTQRPRTASSSAQPAALDRRTSSTKRTPNGAAALNPQRSLPDLRKRPDSTVGRSNTSRLNDEKAISVIYTPHGVSPKVLEPYVRTHLTPLNAMPVTALFHSINVEDNPWFMGGRVAAGAPGGVEVAKAIGAKHWIGAHDELKENRGMATAWIKSKRFKPGDVKKMLWEAGMEKSQVHVLSVGGILRIPERKEHEQMKEQKKVNRAPLMNVDDTTLAMPKTVTDAVRSVTLAGTNLSDRDLYNQDRLTNWVSGPYWGTGPFTRSTSTLVRESSNPSSQLDPLPTASSLKSQRSSRTLVHGSAT